MVRVLLIVAAAGCAGRSQTAPLTPVIEADERPVESVWDEGAFQIVEHDQVDPDAEERFVIRKTGSGYRISIEWERRQPTGELADGSVTLDTDARFAPAVGHDVMNRHRSDGVVEITRSGLRREPDGRLATEITAADGSKQSASSLGTNDWFIGGQLTTFLTVICQASPDFIAPVVYPDKTTALGAPGPLPIADTSREVTVRVLTYAASGNRVVAACEHGRLAGERTRGVTVVRRGDLALARALTTAFP